MLSLNIENPGQLAQASKCFHAFKGSKGLTFCLEILDECFSFESQLIQLIQYKTFITEVLTRFSSMQSLGCRAKQRFKLRAALQHPDKLLTDLCRTFTCYQLIYAAPWHATIWSMPHPDMLPTDPCRTLTCYQLIHVTPWHATNWSMTNPDMLPTDLCCALTCYRIIYAAAPWHATNLSILHTDCAMPYPFFQLNPLQAGSGSKENKVDQKAHLNIWIPNNIYQIFA